MQPRLLAVLIAVTVVAVGAGAIVQGQGTKTSPYVDASGAIALPDPAMVRARWAYLGSWTVISDDAAESVHTVYTQPGSIERFRASGVFPDGAVLVKEVREAETAAMTTGEVARSGAMIQWFVMIKDGHSSHEGNPLWGKGWGWALFLADDPPTNAATDYSSDCLPCHVPAEKNDWVYTEGYPVLHE